MPIFRYFIFVGGALLALLYVADYVVPAQPVAHAVVIAGNDQPLIRIRSDRHLPERVVLDTSQPTVAAPGIRTAAVAVPELQQDVPPALAEMSAKARVRETFAQFTPAAAKPDARPRAQALQPQTAQVPVQSKRKVARTHPGPQPGRPMMLVAQQPHPGLFNTTW